MWALTQSIYIVAKLAYILSENPIDLITDLPTLRSFLIQIRTGQMLLLQLISGFLIAIFAQLFTDRNGFKFILAFSALALTPPAFTGHSGSEKFHWIAVSSWAIHILAVSFWSAAVSALVIIRFKSQDWMSHFKAINRISLFSFIGVLLSGIINSWVRIPDWNSLLESQYGQLILAKSALLFSLFVFGAWYRTKASQNQLEESLTFFRIISLEIFLLGLVIMFGVVLSGTKLPVIFPG